MSSKDTDHMPNNIKNIKFTMGISDFDRKKGRRIPGACSFNEDAVFVVNDAQVKARLTYVVHLTSFECTVKVKCHAPSYGGTKTSKSKLCPNENKPNSITYMKKTRRHFLLGMM